MKAAVSLLFGLAAADVPADLVKQIPGFEPAPFKVYSGFLNVPGPVAGYDQLKIHYQFHESQGNPSKDPLVTWHQGGPGGSSINVGLYSELGYFQITDKGPQVNPYAWNKVANMLYLESPAGSGGDYGPGYSQCFKGGSKVTCSWNDRNQGEAYAHTLQAFFKAFPAYTSHPLYLTGESYFGQYGPNIAHFILNNAPFNTSLNLKGMALGNACSDGDETHVTCLDNENMVDAELFYGKGLFSPKLKEKIDKDCKYPSDSNGLRCMADLLEMRRQVGPHNVYDIYDNCPATTEFLKRTGKDMGWLISYLRQNLHNPSAHAALSNMSGGYDWFCNGDLPKFFKDPEVQKALHLDGETGSRFDYATSGPASIVLYPELVTKLRLLIYNGDSDACVPYIANENWIARMEKQGDLQESTPWTPWFATTKRAPAGYVTKYTAPKAVSGRDVEFQFKTIRLAGHMVPQFQPAAALTMITEFLAGDSQIERVTVV